MRRGDRNHLFIPADEVPTLIVSQDGTGDFDDTDTQAVIAAIQKVQSRGGGAVLVKQGTYEHTSTEPISIPSNVAIKGIEANATLKVADGISPIQLIKAYDVSNIELKGLTLDGNKSCTSAVLDIRKTVPEQPMGNILLEHLTVKGQRADSGGAWLMFCWDTQHERLISNVRLVGCHFEDYGTPNETTADSITFSVCKNIQLIGCTTYNLPRPFQIFGCDNVNVAGCRFEQFNQYGLAIQGTKNCAVSGCVFKSEGSGDTLIIRPILNSETSNVGRHAQNIVIDGCTFDGVSVELASYSDDPVDLGVIHTAISNCMFTGIENTSGFTTALKILKYSGSVVNKWIKLSNLMFYHEGKDNINISDTDRVDIENCVCITGSETSWQTVWLTRATNIHVKGLECVYEAGAYNHRALDVRNGSSVVVEGLHIEGYNGWGGDGVPVYQETDGLITFRGYNYICGKLTQNAGTATIPASSTSVVVSHGLYLTPAKFRLTPTANLGEVWVSNIGADQFTINCENAPASDTAVYWEAEV